MSSKDSLLLLLPALLVVLLLPLLLPFVLMGVRSPLEVDSMTLTERNKGFLS